MKIFNCDLCGARFNEEKELEDHIQVCYCIDCDLKFENKDEFSDHVEQEHTSWIKCKFEDHIPLWYCIKCDKIFEKDGNLDNHVIRLHVFRCEVCGIHKLEESELMDHM